MIKFTDYQARAAQTSGAGMWQPLTQAHTRLTIATLGLAGEAAEVLAILKDSVWSTSDPDNVARLVKELGDVCWYVAELCTCLGLDGIGFPDRQATSWPLSVTGCAGDLCVAVGMVAERVKKHVGHGHDLDRAAVADDLRLALLYVGRLGVVFGVTIEEIAETNLDKLVGPNGRYKDGFSAAASRERVI